jgi:hypothetical protein
MTQRKALQSLGISASRPAYDGDLSAYLGALSRSGEAAEMTDPHGLGGFNWLVHSDLSGRSAQVLASRS